MRRRDDADVDRDLLAPADAEEAPLLQDPEEVDLDLRRDVADLVEEDRPALGQLELPLAPLGGAREGPLLVPEELRLEERLGEGRAGDADERLLGPLAREVEGPRDQLLPRAALAR